MPMRHNIRTLAVLLAVLAAGGVAAQEATNLPDLLQPAVRQYEESFRVAVTSAPPAAARPAPLPPVIPAPEPPLVPAMREITTLQAALDRRGFGCGLIDGQNGGKTRQALLDFRYANATNRLAADEARQVLLDDPAPAFALVEVSSNDLAQVGEAPSDWEEAADLDAMACRTLLEWLSEKFHVSQVLLRRLNPKVSAWDESLAGQRLCVPNVRPEAMKFDVRQIAIDTHVFRLRGYDARGRMVCSFPCSIARDRAKVPAGELTVANVAPHPNYTFDPANFPESVRARQIGRKLILPPGPRNPVGVYWVSLSQPGYGIHGTPHPESIGNMESHGCFRLCNWDAHTLGQGISLGLPVVLDAPARILAK